MFLYGLSEPPAMRPAWLVQLEPALIFTSVLEIYGAFSGDIQCQTFGQFEANGDGAV